MMMKGVMDKNGSICGISAQEPLFDTLGKKILVLVFFEHTQKFVCLRLIQSRPKMT